MPKDLNIIYDYRIKKLLKYTSASIVVLKRNKVYSDKDWYRSHYGIVKAEVKKAYYLPQKRRCAYCRKKLNADAYFSHIDHILPKSLYSGWMFKPKNLVLTCEVCNPLKNADDTLLDTHSKCKFPRKSVGFKIFNPHYDRWSNHFEIEDGIFIRGKDDKGTETIKACKLSQYHFAVQFAEEAEIAPKTTIRKATTRQVKFNKDSLEYKSCLKLIEYYTQLI